jgi:hypothetical protein
MKPPSDAGLTLEQVLAEIDAMKLGRKAHNRIELTDLQKAALLAARPGQADGVPWRQFIAWWHDQGWDGSIDFLRSRYREAADE